MPKFPDDFRVLGADGGASYWWWSPETGPDYDGTWPMGTEPPSGLMISSEESVQAELGLDEWYVVSWEFGPETESGPYRRVGYPDLVGSIQKAVDEVMAEREEEKRVADVQTEV